MRTVGEILRNKRLEKKLDLSGAEKATKIRAKYLEAIEKNRFSSIPGGATVIKGFIKNYSEFLGLSFGDLLAIFRRDFIEGKKGQIIPRGYLEPLGRSGFFWTPKLTIIFVLAMLVVILGFYLFSQYSLFLGAPPLNLSSPREEEVVSQPFVEIIGKTDPDATLYVNGEVKTVFADGSFKETVMLTLGENEITVEAVSRRNKKTRIIRKVKYQLTSQ